jgi:hypothetical protein
VTGVHHTGKDAKRKARGSYVFLTNPDTSIEFVKEGWGTKVSANKQRDGKAGAFCGFQIVPVTIGTNKFGNPMHEQVRQPNRAGGNQVMRCTQHGNKTEEADSPGGKSPGAFG